MKMYKHHELTSPIIFRQPARLWSLFSSVSAALGGPHTFWRNRQFPRSPAKTISVFLPVDASHKRILAPGSIDSFAEHLLAQHSLRSELELGATFSELTI
jgi:hypothetical protein